MPGHHNFRCIAFSTKQKTATPQQLPDVRRNADGQNCGSNSPPGLLLGSRDRMDAALERGTGKMMPTRNVVGTSAHASAYWMPLPMSYHPWLPYGA